MADFTPMMKQYLAIKEQNKDSLLFFRLGDFYELFFEDAKIASKELDLVLTGKDCGQSERAPMCGIPYHSSESYIARLVAKGYKVSICEQMEDPAMAKGLVKRDIIRTVSPGTITEDTMLDDRKSNYIAGVFYGHHTAGVVFCDVSTGEINATGASGVDRTTHIISELARYAPSEIILNEEAYQDKNILAYLNKHNKVRHSVEEESFHLPDALTEAEHRFSQLPVVNSAYKESLFCAVGGLLLYLTCAKKSNLDYINRLNIYQETSFMDIGETAFRNLEIAETMIGHSKSGSLLGVMDSNITGMGSRKLRKWVEKPLLNPAAIDKRLNAVAELVDDTMLREEMRLKLKSVTDLERLNTRIVYGTANARDLRALCSALFVLPDLIESLKGISSSLLKDTRQQIDPLNDVCALIDASIAEDAPALIRDGNLIRDGYNPEVDRLRYLSKHGREAIAGVEARERERTGIKNLKISYNKVFGYFIDITNANRNLVPEDYIRKQTLVNSERYITDELKKIESDVLTADEKQKSLEYDLFNEIRKRIAEQSRRIQLTADGISTLDVLLSLATNAVNYRYVRPYVDLSDKLEIKNGRHPVVERMTDGELFVPNDVSLDCRENRIAVITGPNMAGKSTYMRQVALIVLMSQVGSFVPADSAHVGIVDKIFTRVGASDDLASGRSTFMVEMSEVSEILENATVKSLIILDEIGRGTSTFDGMSIARAVVEFINDPKKIGARTLFATHYHELTALETELSGVNNYNIAVKKRGDHISFLRKIVPGGCDDSYGIEVALLAGLPQPVIQRAKSILAQLEQSIPQRDFCNIKNDIPEEFSFSSTGQVKLIEELSSLTIETMTPIEALNKLHLLIKQAKEIG